MKYPWHWLEILIQVTLLVNSILHQIRKIYFSELFKALLLVKEIICIWRCYCINFVYKFVSVMIDFDNIYYKFLIYKTLILFREKDLELMVAASGAQDPEKSVRIPGIF